MSKSKANVPCPHEIVSKVIGNKGENIKKIRAQVGEGCFIQGIAKAPGHVEVSCNTKDATTLASSLLKKLIEEVKHKSAAEPNSKGNKAEKKNNKNGKSNDNAEDATTDKNAKPNKAKPNKEKKSSGQMVNVPCPKDMISKVIGHKGENIKWVMAEVGEFCFIKGIPTNFPHFEVSGNTKDATEKAVKLLKKVMEDVQQQEAVQVPCPAEIVGMVIGKGEKLAEIRNSVGEGCYIRGFEAHFEISSKSAEASEQAAKLLKAYIEETEEASARRASGIQEDADGSELPARGGSGGTSLRGRGGRGRGRGGGEGFSLGGAAGGRGAPQGRGASRVLNTDVPASRQKRTRLNEDE